MRNLLDALTQRPSRRHEVADGGCVRLSPSRLNLWLRCPLAYKLKYIDCIKLPTTEREFLDQRIHSALANYYRHRKQGIQLCIRDCVNSMHSGWDAAVAEGHMAFTCSTQEQQLKQQAAALIGAYLRNSPVGEVEILAVESRLESPAVDPITGEQLPIILTSVVDLVLDGKSGPIIVDFRTASRSSAALELAHEVKLSLHAYLVREHFGRKESELQVRSLIKTKVSRIETHKFPQRRREHFTRLFAVSREYLDSLDCGIFNYRPAWTCTLCDFAESHCQGFCG